MVIANGSVVDKGTHTELLAKRSVYDQLHEHLIGDENSKKQLIRNFIIT